MSKARNLIDPTFFDDALTQFDDEYTAYIAEDISVDEFGYQKRKYSAHKIRGSLQSQGKRKSMSSSSGNTYQWGFNFYCKSSYPLDIGDYIYARDVLLIVTSVQDLDEWGVRSMTLEMTSLADKKDLEDFIKFEDGRQIR